MAKLDTKRKRYVPPDFGFVTLYSQMKGKPPAREMLSRNREVWWEGGAGVFVSCSFRGLHSDQRTLFLNREESCVEGQMY